MVESNVVCLILCLFHKQTDCHNKSNGYILVQARLGVLYNQENVCLLVSAKMSLEVLA